MRFPRVITLCAAFFLLGSLHAGSTDATTRSPRRVSGTVVELQTNYGNIRIKLYPKKAPKTVANFLRYVKSGHYNGTIFHRVIPNFMIQGGGYTTSFSKKAVKSPIVNEADNGLKNYRGTVAMARTSNPHSAQAQFFINNKTNHFLNHRRKDKSGWGYCVFGKVSSGMNVVDKISGVSTGRRSRLSNVPVINVVIKKARIVK